jgi:hypothetical protein
MKTLSSGVGPVPSPVNLRVNCRFSKTGEGPGPTLSNCPTLSSRPVRYGYLSNRTNQGVPRGPTGATSPS